MWLFPAAQLLKCCLQDVEFSRIVRIFRYELYTLAVGSTQNTSFPLSSDCKASLCSDFKANPSSWASKSRGSTSAITRRNDLLKTLLDNLLTACIEFSQWENFPWLGKWVIRTNITYAKRTVRIFRFSPQSHSPFSASFQTFRLTARAYLNTQKYGLFCSLRAKGQNKDKSGNCGLRGWFNIVQDGGQT